MRQILKSEDTFGTTMLTLCIDAFGCDPEDGQPYVFKWHPVTVMQEIEDQWGITINRTTYDKLMAAICVVTTDLFCKNVDRFIKLTNALAGHGHSPETIDTTDSIECAWAITEALLLHPPDEDDPEPFSDEVRHYVSRVLHEEGYVKPPDILRIALDADFTNQVRYNFGDDPEMFQGIYATQMEKTEEVQDILKQNLLELADQLKALPLQRGKTAETLKRIGALFEKVGEKTAEEQSVTFEKIAHLFEGAQ